MSGSFQQPTSSSPIEYRKAQAYEDDSCESFTSYSDEFLQFSPSLKLHPRMSSTFNHAQPLLSKDYKAYKESTKENIDDAIDCTDASANISVWERWLVAKLQLEREKSKLKKIQHKIDKEEEEKKLKEKERKKIETQEKQQEWLEKKLTKIKFEKNNEKRQELIKKEIEVEKAEKLRVEAELKFNEWMEKHQKTDHLKRLKEKRQKEKQKQIQENKKQKAEENFQQWLRDNKERLASLKIKEPATPSYVNPIPWVGPDQDATRRRPEETSRPQSCIERNRPFNFSARRCSTPKPRSRSVATHTPMRTGKADRNTSICPVRLLRVHTPLRFSGYRPKSERSLQRKPDTRECRRSTSTKPLTPPRPLTGMSAPHRQKTSKGVR